MSLKQLNERRIKLLADYNVTQGVRQRINNDITSKMAKDEEYQTLTKKVKRFKFHSEAVTKVQAAIDFYKEGGIISGLVLWHILAEHSVIEPQFSMEENKTAYFNLFDNSIAKSAESVENNKDIAGKLWELVEPYVKETNKYSEMAIKMEVDLLEKAIADNKVKPRKGV